MAAKRRCDDNADLTLTMKQDRRDIGAINALMNKANREKVFSAQSSSECCFEVLLDGLEPFQYPRFKEKSCSKCLQVKKCVDCSSCLKSVCASCCGICEKCKMPICTTCTRIKYQKDGDHVYCIDCYQ